MFNESSDVFRFTKDPVTMGELNYKKLQTPQIINTRKHSPSPVRPHLLMDKININQNGFIEILDKDSDITILPLSINLELRIHERPGPIYKYG